jgi:putative ABC transport system permease protein
VVVVENFRIALGALRANALRSFLTTLGIIIGVAAVVAVVSIVQGLQYMITAELEGVGATYVQVVPRVQFSSPGQITKPVELTWEDGLTIRRQLPEVDQITPLIFGGATAKYRNRSYRPSFVFGVNDSYQEMSRQFVERGRYLSAIDLDSRRKVAVLGRTVAEELELGSEPVGKEIYVGSLPMTVIGILEEKGRSLGFDQDDQIQVPFDTALSIFGRNAGKQVRLQMQLASAEDVEGAKERIRQLLRRRHELADDQPDDFVVQTQDEIVETTNALLQGVTGVVAGIVGIALLVGGIGIMNIMLVSVTERTREIGVRKAVGARKRDVLVQFLIEAVTLALAGGAVGILVGYGLGAMAVRLIPGDLPPAHVPLWAVVLAAGFSAFVGIASGLYPAAKASALDPIEALRYE